MNSKTLVIILLSLAVIVFSTLAFVFPSMKILLPIAFIFLGILNIFNGVIQLKSKNKAFGGFGLIPGIFILIIGIAATVALLFFVK